MLLCLAAGVLVALYLRRDARRRPPAPISSPAASHDPTAAASAAQEAGARPGAPGRPRAAPGQPAGTAAGQPSRALSATERAQLLQRLAQARQRRLGGGPAAAPRDPGPASDPLEPAYIQARMRELLPLVRECYETAAERIPDLAGLVELEFVMAGEAEVGGIVESSKVLPGSTLRDPEFTECVTETMYGLQFTPPADGGRVVVRYPLQFGPEPAETPPVRENQH
jgi:hypothetical protein